MDEETNYPQYFRVTNLLNGITAYSQININNNTNSQELVQTLKKGKQAYKEITLAKIHCQKTINQIDTGTLKGFKDTAIYHSNNHILKAYSTLLKKAKVLAN